MKRNLPAVITVAVLAALVGGAAYYVNSVYLPAKQREAANALRTDVTEAVEGSDYDYTIRGGDSASVSTDKIAEDSSVTITTDEETGDVWITRDWLNDGGSRVSSEPPADEEVGRAEANIGSGGANIVGEDGVYHGEQPTTPPPAMPAPSTEQTSASGTQPTQQEPAAERTPNTPGTSKERKPVETTKPADTQPAATQPSEQAKPSASDSGGSGSSTPKQGEMRTVDGKTEMWVNGFGWIPSGSGSYSEPSAGTSNGDWGDVVPNAEF